MRQRFVAFAMVALAVQAATETTEAGQQHAPLAPRFIDAASGLTLSQAIERSLAEEPGLRAARAQIDVARGRREQAEARPNPTVTFAQLQEPGGTDAQTRVEVQWPLDLFRKPGRVTVANREIDVTQQATADRERVLMADVRMKFGEALAAVRELSVTDELVDATARQHALMAARAEAGAIPPLERDLVRVELQRLEADRLLQAGHAEHAVIALKRLLGLRADAMLTLRDDLEQVVASEVAVDLPATDTAIRVRSDVNEATARVNVAAAQIDQARREGRFDISVFGMYMRTDTGFSQRGFGPASELEPVHGVFHNVGGGVMVSVPLRDRKQGDVAAAQAQRAGAQAELQARRLTAEAEIASARARDDHARRALAIYTSETRSLAKRNLDVVSQTYDAGRMTLFDVLNERRRFLEIERGYTHALREVYEARQALRTALGEVR